MAKKIESKLDRYAEQLSAMEAEGKTLAEMQAWLKAEACAISLSGLSRWLESARSARSQERFLTLVATGGRQCQELDAAFKKNPEPGIATLIKMFQVIILKLNIEGSANPENLKLADQLSRTALEFINGQTRAEFKRVELDQAERKLKLSEQKAAQADQAKGILQSKDLSEEQKRQRMLELFGI